MNPSDPLYGLTGSQLRQAKPPMPFGVYVIAGLSALSFAASFFDTSQTSLLYTLIMLVSLLATVGLLLRVAAARTVMLWVFALTIIASIISAVLLIGVQHRIAASKQRYNVALQHIDTTQLTMADKAKLATIERTITDSERKAGKAITYTYTILAVYTLESIGGSVYLSRPRVKAIFER